MLHPIAVCYIARPGRAHRCLDCRLRRGFNGDMVMTLPSGRVGIAPELAESESVQK